MTTVRRHSSLALPSTIARLQAQPPRRAQKSTAPVDTFQATPARDASVLPSTIDTGTIQQMVTDAYVNVLGRQPDGPGLANWMGAASDLAAQGANPDQTQSWLDSQMKSSTEYQALQLTGQVFQDVMGRPDDPGDYWHQQAGQMASEGSSLQDVSDWLTRSLQGSDEYRFAHVGDMIAEQYRQLLNRAPDPEGLAHYTDLATQMQEGGSSADEVQTAIATEIQQSPEYASAHPSPSGGVLAGADTSNNQSDNGTFEQSIAGTQWTAIKATQGTGFNDPTFQSRWNELGQKVQDGQMTLRVAYQFMEAGDGVAQAQHLLAQVGVSGPLPAGTRLALDWENSPQSPNTLSDPKALQDAAHYIEQVTGALPIIYTSGGIVDQVKSLVPGAPIWDASWGGTPRPDDTFFQSDDGTQSQPWDHDIFNGDLAALRQFAGYDDVVTDTASIAPNGG